MRLPNGYGSVYKLSGKRRKPYGVRKTIGWDDNGKQQYQIIGYYTSRQEALQALALFNENPYTIEAKQITVKELFDKWQKQKFPNIAYKTQRVYLMCWNYCKEIESMSFVDIKTITLQKIVDSMGDKWSAKKAFKVMFNQLYDFAIKNDICDKKYSSYIELGKKAPKLKRLPFEEWEIQKLWNNIDRMDFIDCVLILIYSGVRIGELLDIKIEDVFIDEEYMKGGSKTEAGKDRIIPLHKKILPLVKKWYDRAKEVGSEYLIFNHEYKQMLYWNFYHEKWDKIMEQLELDHKPHDTRHTFATRMDRTSANKLCIKRILGHASKDITDKVYTHKDISDLIEAINLLE